VNHRSLLSDVRYRGLVRAAKRAYHVYEGREHFVLLSPSTSHGGYYHILERRALNYVLGHVGGSRSITVREVRDACRRSKFLADRFAVLNTLYALVALKKARITAMRDKALVFAVSKGTV
jgi:hypothetical protein